MWHDVANPTVYGTVKKVGVLEFKSAKGVSMGLNVIEEDGDKLIIKIGGEVSEVHRADSNEKVC